MSSLDQALIGNCSFAALIDRMGCISWACMPRFDGDPIFCSLLKGGEEAARDGFFDIAIDDFARSEQHYLQNTAILRTTLYDSTGAAVEITDFAPRFRRYDRMFRPLTIVRQVRPVIGHPRIRVRVRPTYNYGAERPAVTHGSNHLRYVTPQFVLRLNTEAPVSYVQNEIPFVLEEPFTLLLGPDESLTDSISETGREFLDYTYRFWREWSRYLSIPFEWQDAVIRAAITLKLCSFEESGAIIAAVTSSIPEFPDSGRTWDYRYCWLRDAFFVVHALNRLGATRTMEDYLRYITNIVAASRDGSLQPVYGITLEHRLDEQLLEALPGYRGMGPVRVGNQAYQQVQNDIYGAVILAAAQSFFDQRLERAGGVRLFERLEKVGHQALRLYDQPDAGLWELRTKSGVHTFTSAMSWAGCDRLARIASHLGLNARAAFWRSQADHIREVILEKAWNEERQSFVGSFGGDELDASLLLLQQLGFVEADDWRFLNTVKAIEKELKRGNHLHRYVHEDDFGEPETAFNICTFWYINALAAIGRQEEAREMFETMLSHRNHVGLLSEDLCPETGELWGNFPQTYSMVGLITSAMILSKPWEEAF